MKLFKNKVKSYSKLDEEKLREKKWYIFKFEMFVILGLIFLIAILNQIPNWIVKPLGNGKIDIHLSYPLRDNIAYTSFSVFTTIGVAIFIGVYTEMGKFAGKYGSALFILVPSFVWLLSDRSDNRIDHILETNLFLGDFVFYSSIFLVSTFLIMMFVKFIIRRMMVAQNSKLRLEYYYNLVSRIIIILVNILIILILGYTLINYGLLSLHLADITPEMKQKDPSLHGTHNLHSEMFTTYIAIIAIFFALLMVSIGMANIETRNGHVVIDGHQAEKRISINNLNRQEKTKGKMRSRDIGGKDG